jgi:hypothetical protein
MKKIKVSLPVLFAVVAFLGGKPAAAQVLDKKLSFKEGTQLVIKSSVGGTFEVIGTKGKQPSVQAYYDAAKWKDYQVDLDQGASVVTVTVKRKGKLGEFEEGPRFVLTVPRELDMRADITGGDLLTRDLEGDKTVSMQGGFFTMDKGAGKLDVKMNGGSVALNDAGVAGSVVVTGGVLKANNIMGNLNTAVHGGPIELTNSLLAGKVEAHGGNIRLVNTVIGGEVIGYGGNIEATTKGVPKAGNPGMQLSTFGGETVLILPESPSMNVDIELTYKDNAPDSFNIVSDFDFERNETVKPGAANEASERHVYGKAEMGAGANAIKITAQNGNVYLKKKSTP